MTKTGGIKNDEFYLFDPQNRIVLKGVSKPNVFLSMKK